MKQEKSYFDQVYKANYQRVMRLCRGYVKGDEDLAKDLTQEVFIKVWQCLPSFRNEANIATWIYRITVNTCMLQFRKKKFYKDVNALDGLSNPRAENNTPKEDRLKKMYRCIDTLSEENKGIILLELEGLPQRDIAAVMGISHDAIRVRVHRIKNSLTKCVQNDNV